MGGMGGFSARCKIGTQRRGLRFYKRSNWWCYPDQDIQEYSGPGLFFLMGSGMQCFNEKRSKWILPTEVSTDIPVEDIEETNLLRR